MIVYAVTIYVKKENVMDFITATTENHRGTRKEPGNIRFDVLRSEKEPDKFLLYEVYESMSAVDDHKKTAHYMKWRDTVENWMEKPREGQSFSIICPQDKDLW